MVHVPDLRRSSSPSPQLRIFKGPRSAINSLFDLVLGDSGLVGPVTWFLAKLAKARSTVHVHGLDRVVKNLVYQKLFVPFIRRHDCVVANSLNTRDIAIDKGCPEENLRVVNPGAAIPVGGVVDAVADGVNGVLVNEGDYQAFADAVVSICHGGPPGRSSCRNHAETFSWEAHGRNLLAALDLAVGPA